MISAKIVADSKNEFGNRITTMVVTMPRIILSEFNTHRMFSRNSASSRAIPFEKMVKSVEENPFIPIAWQKDHKGMQGTKYFTDQSDIDELVANHLEARDHAVVAAYKQATKGLTKQICNRYLEPFMWHTVIVTATDWENFFTLRCPQYEWRTGTVDKIYRSRKDIAKYQGHTWTDEEYNDQSLWLTTNKGQAEIHMMALAEAMWDALNESKPKELKAGEWHVPYADKIDGQSILDAMINLKQAIDSRTMSNPGGDADEDMADTINRGLIKISTVMCARTSYTAVGEDLKPMTYEKMIELHDKLVNANPLHASPMEHCASAMSESDYYTHIRGGVTNYVKTGIKMITSHCNSDSDIFGWSGNFRGFVQYRKMFKNENITI